MDRFFRDVSHAYTVNILDRGKEAQAVILVTFLLTFIAVRFITHSIRDDRFKRIFHNMSGPGGTHLHHLVPGILLLLVSGFTGIGVDAREYRIATAVLFGIGAALTLDEFALWLHLEDVYWAKEGRQSVDAVVVAATILCVLGSLMVSYTRARAEALGLECKVGLAQRPPRVVILAIGIVFAGVGLGGVSLLALSVYALALLTSATAVQRVLHVRAALNRPAEV
jgi:hypothetical protein